MLNRVSIRLNCCEKFYHHFWNIKKYNDKYYNHFNLCKNGTTILQARSYLLINYNLKILEQIDSLHATPWLRTHIKLNMFRHYLLVFYIVKSSKHFQYLVTLCRWSKISTCLKLAPSDASWIMFVGPGATVCERTHDSTLPKRIEPSKVLHQKEGFRATGMWTRAQKGCRTVWTESESAQAAQK